MSPSVPSGKSPRTWPTLTAALRARDDASITALLRARPDLALPVPGDLAGLASRATTRTSVLRAVDALDAACLQVLDAMLVAGDGCRLEEIRVLLGEPAPAPNSARAGPPAPGTDATSTGSAAPKTKAARARKSATTASATVAAAPPDPTDPVAAAAARLAVRALVWGDDEGGFTVVRTMRQIAGHYPCGLGPPYLEALAGSPRHRLELIATTLGLEVPAAAGVEAVTTALSAPAELVRVVDEVIAREPAALQPLDDLTWGPPVGSLPNALREIEPSELSGAVETLIAYGLLVAVSGTTVVLPREVGIALRGGRIHDQSRLLEPALVTEARVSKVVADTAAGAAATAVSRVETLLDSWGLNPPQVLRAGGLSVRDTHAAAVLLGVGDDEAALLAELAHGAGLCTRARGGSLRDNEEWLPTTEYDAWRRRPIAERWLALASVWIATSRLPGLAGQRDDRDRRLAALGPDLDRVAGPQLRMAVLEVLSDVPAGFAATEASVVGLVQWQGPRRGGDLHESIVGWTFREAARLGMTGLGEMSPFARAMARSLGEAVDVLNELLPDPVDHVLLQADLTAVAPGPLVPEIAQELALAADVESTGGATVFRFTPASVRRALDAGRGAADVHAMLARYSRTPVPQPLSYLVDDVARRHGRVRVISVSAVIRADDESMADTLLSDRTLVSLGLRRVAPTVLVTTAHSEQVVTALRAAGHAPVAETGAGEVVLRRPDSRRAPAARRPSRVAMPRPTEEAVIANAVRAMRAGDRALAVRPSGAMTYSADHPLPGSTMDVLDVLRTATETGDPVWISYLDNDGVSSERIVDPLRLAGGWLTAYDHLRAATRTFVVHRIMAIAPVSDDELDIDYPSTPGAGQR